MERKRFELALRELRPSDWELFEQLASAFAVIDFGNLRTVASYAGDDGRDAFLFSPNDDETVVFQYSVTKNAGTKIRATAARLASTVPTARELIYVTSQPIGVSCDGVKSDLRRQYRITLDVWDRNWFLDRLNTHPQRVMAAESLAHAIVDPLLATYDVIGTQAPALTGDEERCAAVYLALQAEDKRTDKGWTKVAYESLVRAALRNTDSDHRMARTEVYSSVQVFVPTGVDVKSHVDRALRKLSGKSIRHWQAPDEFCLAHEERMRILERAVDLDELQEAFRSKVAAYIEPLAEALGVDLTANIGSATALTQRTVDMVMLDAGERLASALDSGDIANFRSESIERLVSRLVPSEPLLESDTNRTVVVRAAVAAIRSTEPAIVRYLKIWKDSYTLFSLLHETPDVQKTVVKLFSHGRIWLDTNIILPLIAERLIDDESQRTWTNLLATATDAGLVFCVTNGVVEEISAQMRRSLAYVWTSQQSKTWVGRIPFLYIVYVLSGADPASLPSWLDQFRGGAQPEQDVADFLADEFRIQKDDLAVSAQSASVELRGAVQEIFRDLGEQRYRDFAPAKVTLLIEHDVECYLGTLQRRKGEPGSSLGFTSWWLTLDGIAYRVHSTLPSYYAAGPIPSSPVMSPDFLLNYLEIGPLRARVANSPVSYLPPIMDISFMEGVSQEVLATAERVRSENEGVSRRIVQRHIRDAVNALRGAGGIIAAEGSDAFERDVMDSIAEQSGQSPHIQRM